MTFLSAIPVWVYFIIIAITFMVMHVLTLRANQPQNRARSFLGRIGSSLILLVVLVLLDPSEPASVLTALLGAVIAGIVSGRTATPPLPPRTAGAEPGGDEPEPAEGKEPNEGQPGR